MPQLIAIALAGAGLYAGYKWVRREWRRAADTAERVTAELQRAARNPRDLGRLEWDDNAKVFKPTSKSSAG